MTVPESQRGKNKFEVFLVARDLAAYTLQITSNSKTFDEKQGGALAYEIAKTATEIYTDAWRANNIMVGKDSSKWQRRSELQCCAAEKCNGLLAAIELAHKVYHLSGRRVKYWTEKVLHTRNLIRKWHEGDRNRYSGL